MGEELRVDVDVSQEHNPNMFLIDHEELEKLRNHMFTIKGHRKQVFLAATITTGIC